MSHRIMLIEDNPDHALLIQAALEMAHLSVQATVISDGAQALDYIRAQALTPVLPLPGVVLLDLKLPKVDGLEILRTLRSLPAWRAVPVIVLTTSSHPGDVQASMAYGANYFLSKISVLNGAMSELVQTIQASLARVSPPPGEPHGRTAR